MSGSMDLEGARKANLLMHNANWFLATAISAMAEGEPQHEVHEQLVNAAKELVDAMQIMCEYNVGFPKDSAKK